MRLLNKAEQSVKRIFAVQRGYFIDSGREIAARNLRLIRLASGTGIIIYIAYLLVTVLFFQKWTISLLYGLIVPVLGLFLLYSKKAIQAETVNAKKAQQATLLLYCALMLYAITMSIFPHPDVPSVYYPLFLLMAPVVFILPAYQQTIMTIVSLMLFYALVLGYKSPACWSHELFEATTSAVFSMVVILFMTQFRIQSDSLKEKYYKLSRQDSLTGIVNKTTGLEIAQDYINELRYDESCAILFVDIDSFKSYNDTFGHLEGDKLLTMIGATLTSLCRKNDIVCRFGGDEFIILLKDMQTIDMAVQKAQNIIDSVSRIDLPSKQTMTCSIGIYYRDNECTTIEEMIHRADIALYQAKSNGKNSYAIYSKEIANRPIQGHTSPGVNQNTLL